MTVRTYIAVSDHFIYGFGETEEDAIDSARDFCDCAGHEYPEYDIRTYYAEVYDVEDETSIPYDARWIEVE